MLMTSILGSLLPPGKTRSIGVTFFLLCIFAAGRANTSGDIVQDEVLGIQSLIILVQWVSFHLLHTAEREYGRVSGTVDKDEEDGSVPEIFSSLPETWLGRLVWATGLRLNLGGVGWN
ncbi:hypothetical protein BJ878DRAFT_490295 [Calycina marina]|uniref:Uncharacterized protein n=1 Tax=Calycina marina TaxID=1763456 RepID=A0A9P8CIH1_9HELO|nr:hypothetical protein BJ878DRAFT_490295 [Calycina marina]